MKAFTAWMLVSMLLVSMVVGVRLLLVARRTRGLPELLFGLGFLGGGIGQAFGALGARLLWTTPGPLATPLNTAFFFIVVVATGCLFAAVWQVFCSQDRRGVVTFFVGTGAALVAYGMRFHAGDFGSGAVDSLGNMLFTVTRVSLFIWAAVEAFHSYGILRKRVRLELASPVATNQILLWGLAAVFSAAMTLVIGHNTITLHRSPLEDPLSMALLLLFVILASVSMWCSFFPPAALRRRLEARAHA